MSVLDIDAVRAVTRLIDKGFEAYLVGGCVRDLLLDRTPKDYDIATEARPPQVKRTFPRNCRIIGRRFKLAHLHFHGNTKILECSTFRRTPQERPEGEGEDADLLITRDNEFGTAEEDALRRDFTINALFLDPTRDLIVDHVKGLEDIEARVIRTIGDPVVRFREDPVRILRAAKFAGRLGFTIEKKTLAAMSETAEDLTRAAPPRVLEEILRLLRSGHARSSFELLRDIGAIEHLIPVVGNFLKEAGKKQLDTFWELLEALDSRMQSLADGTEPPPNGVLLAVMMYGAVASGRERNPTRSPSSIAENLLGSLAIDLRLPRRDAGCLKRICGVQHRFEQPEGKRRFGVEAFLHSPYFEEALQLYALRTLAAGGERTNIDHWYDLSDDHSTSDQAVEEQAGPDIKKSDSRSSSKIPSDEAADDRGADASEDPAVSPRKKRRRRPRRRSDDKEEATDMKVDDASADTSSSARADAEVDTDHEQAGDNDPNVDSGSQQDAVEPDAVETKAVARKRKPRKRTPRVKRPAEEEEDLSDVTFPSAEPVKAQEEPDESAKPAPTEQKKRSRRQSHSEQGHSEQARNEQGRNEQGGSEQETIQRESDYEVSPNDQRDAYSRHADDQRDRTNNRDAKPEDDSTRDYADQDSPTDNDAVEPRRTRSKRARRSRSRSKVDQEDTTASSDNRERESDDRRSDDRHSDDRHSDARHSDERHSDERHSDERRSDDRRSDARRSDARRSDASHDDREPREDVRDSESQDEGQESAPKRRRGQRGRRRGRRDPQSAEGVSEDRTQSESHERADEGRNADRSADRSADTRRAPAKSRGKKAANARDNDQRARGPKHRNSSNDSKRGSKRDSRRDSKRGNQAARSTGGRDVDVVPRYRDRRGKVEVIEPASLDLSAFDVELDPKRVPTFGSIVEGKGRPKRRGPRIMDEQNDSYRPPPPPSEGSPSPNSPPPAPPADGPDTFGDW